MAIARKKTIKKKNLEFKLQCQCVSWFRMQYPKELIFAIPNGGSRRIVEAVNFKRMGVLAGVPDLMLVKANKNYNGLFIEMKVGKGKESDSQVEVGSTIKEKGYDYKVCRSFEEFIEIISNYFL